MRKILLILLFIPLQLFATKYYIDEGGSDDTGDGSIGNPWATLYYASTQCTTPGDTIFVNAGTYSESHNCDISVGVSIMGEGVTSHIDFTQASTNYTDASIRLISANEATDGSQSISYLYLDGNSQASYHGVYVERRSNVKIHHCTFIDFRYNAVHFRNKLGGYEYNQRPTVYATGNELHDCIITNCSEIDYDFELFPTHGHGNIRIACQKDIKIYNDTITQTGGAEGYNANIIDALEGNNQGLRYYNNVSYKPLTNGSNWNFHIEHWDILGGFEVYDNEFYGGDCVFDIGGYHNTIYYPGNYDSTMAFHDNLIDHTGVPPWGSYPQAIGIEALCEDIYIYNNHFIDHPWPINSSIETSGSYHQDRIYVYYNIFENCGFNGGQWGGVLQFKSYVAGAEYNDWYIYNNVFQANTTYASSSMAWFELSGPANNIQFKNNIVKDFDQATIYVYTRMNPAGQIDTLIFQYNDTYNNGNSNNIRYQGSENITHLISSNNITDNPDFADYLAPLDTFDLQDVSPCIDAGIGVGLTYDYKGNLIDEDPDMGAIEYDGEEPEPPPDPPTVTIGIPEVIYTRQARCSGNVTDDGGGTVSARGLCWSTSINPTTSDSHIACGTGTGAFSGFIDNIQAGTTYHVRSYATNEEATSYGEDRTFTTPINSKVKTSGNYYRLNGQTVVIH